jgi:hypothetical protein
VIAFDAIGAVAGSSMPYAWHYRCHAGGYAPALSVMTRRGLVPLEAIARSKKLRAATLSRWRHIGVDDLSVSVDGAINVVPAATDPSVGLVHAPARTHRIAVLAGHFTEQRQKALDPAIDRALVDQDATLGKPLADPPRSSVGSGRTSERPRR